MTPEDDISGTGGSSRMKWNLLGWKCYWDVMEFWEDLELLRLLNELDDMVTLNGVNGRSDTCRHLDEWSFFYHYSMFSFFTLLRYSLYTLSTVFRR